MIGLRVPTSTARHRESSSVSADARSDSSPGIGPSRWPFPHHVTRPRARVRSRLYRPVPPQTPTMILVNPRASACANAVLPLASTAAMSAPAPSAAPSLPPQSFRCVRVHEERRHGEKFRIGFLDSGLFHIRGRASSSSANRRGRVVLARPAAAACRRNSLFSCRPRSSAPAPAASWTMSTKSL
jgi:hypothetical protein